MNAAVSSTRRFLDRLFSEAPLERVSLRLWDGSRWPDDRPRPATVVLKHPGAVRSMLASRNAKGLGEAYLRNDFDVEGDIEESLELAVALESKRSGFFESLADYFRLLRLPGPEAERGARLGNSIALEGAEHSLDRDRKAVSFHYDVSNEFYQLWLDRRMIYSCGYFETPEDDLDTAQANKLRHLCRKLRLAPGQRLLDIGCGWGGLAIFAARNFGVSVVGVTLSERQAELANERVREAGLSDRVRIELRDYREVKVADPFDAIVSVGMSEHVGRDHLPEYFRTAWALLRPGGVFLNHAIGEGLQTDRFHGPSFVNEHVFPDGDIPPIQVVLASAAPAGFDVRDVENLREHYTLTLRHWVRRLEARREDARKFVDEPTYRVWRLYMAASAHGFDHGDLGLYQVLLSKPMPDGATGLPLTRRDWYA
ncbi:MAG: putative cyclopropane-fatty-acyl-phospholipid synthase [Verrucomicrobia bacterium]|nr:putative cyclopropane-fatty-acyl-phospholipid synthase [Verrucomicrobiota bacterium]